MYPNVRQKRKRQQVLTVSLTLQLTAMTVAALPERANQVTVEQAHPPGLTTEPPATGAGDGPIDIRPRTGGSSRTAHAG